LSVVIDSSIALAWVLPDELSALADKILVQVVEGGAVVPSIFRAEVGNSLVVALRRQRINRPERAIALEQIGALMVVVDPDTDEHIWSDTLELADRYQLTLYDASYLELAMRAQLPLATLHNRLARAARQSGIQTPVWTDV
jgi:predicted nucleic acid-binding protein